MKHQSLRNDSRSAPIGAIALLLALLSGAAGPLVAIEPWADREMPVVDGLELWLDASRIAAARGARGEPGPINDEAILRWPDASGRKRDVTAVSPGRAPTFQSDLGGAAAAKGAGGTINGAALRFDGLDDALEIRGLASKLGACTVLVVAAPRANPGSFRAFLSFGESGKNDYVTGLNIDQGAVATEAFEFLNVEGRGFPGVKDLLEATFDFGTFHRISVVSVPGAGGVKIGVDGERTGARDRNALDGDLAFEELHVGARSYSNTADPVKPRDHFGGEIAEVMVFGRALSDEELARIEEHLQKKHARLFSLAGSPGRPARPAIQLLAPGFEARELPVKLTNINDLLYEPSGALLALGYDGRIHRLTDSDGDGLEDRVEPFWYERTISNPISMAIGPGGLAAGLYVASHGKISRLIDTDGDARADREEIVTDGWEQPQVASGGGVDALGLAFDAEGNLYFGLGCADFTNAYLVKDGAPHYRIGSERGTILRLAPGSKKREILCTGIRFSYTLAFNRLGDLFATDQEGETWLPGGNPLDELDHIRPGVHYGFPPRHEKFLPGVVDEPPVVAFGPQHQSTCGLAFNEPSAGGKAFGPPEWAGDAFVAGYSRGKLWRVRLVKTPAGYIGKSTLFASAALLLLDVALSPRGDLTISCHSGGPDWGTGPNGRGRLFQIRQVERGAPLAAAVYPSGPAEVEVDFDRPLPSTAGARLESGTIDFGEHVRAADRLEVHRPGYASVEKQQAAPRGRLRITGAAPSDQGRALLLATDPHPLRATYALTIPASAIGRKGDGQEGDVDLSYDLSGVEAVWDGAGTGASVGTKARGHTKFWLPHLDLDVSRALLRGSRRLEELEECLKLPGRLTLKTKLLLPAGRAALRLESIGAITSDLPLVTDVAKGSSRITLEEGRSGPVPLELTPVPLELTLQTGASKEPLHLRIALEQEGRPERPLPFEWQLLPWASERTPAPAAPTGPPPALLGGSWQRGREVFESKEARCSQCHAVRGAGGKIGPDLSNLVERDPASVEREIRDPSATINPDYVPSSVVLKDGRVLVGLARAEGAGKLRIADTEARETIVERGDVREILPAAASIMPQGQAEALGPKRMRDLLTFLTQRETPPRPPRDPAIRPIAIVLCAGPKDHGPGEHDYPEWQRRWKDLLERVPGARVSTAWGWPERGQWELADVVVMYFWNHDWSPERYRDLDAYLARGGGLVLLHSAVIPEKEPQALAARIGLAWEPNKTKFRHGAMELRFTDPASSPITRGYSALSLEDETYWPLVGDLASVKILATAEEEGKAQPMLWTCEPGEGRVVATILGHYLKTFDDPRVRELILRAVAWAAEVPAERFRGVIEGK